MYKYIIFLLNIYSGLLAFRLEGEVMDDQFNPVSFATIHNISADQWVTTDELGHFSMNCSVSDSLLCTRYGYQPTGVTVNAPSFLTFYLPINPIQFSPVEIKKFRPLVSSFSKEYFFHHKIPGGMISKLRHIAGVNIRSYGGYASNGSISIDGGPGSHTKIVYENIDVTNPQNGETDISQLPIEMISSATVSRQPGLFYGSGTTDGVIHLKNNHPDSRFSAGMGSWGRKSWFAQTGIKKPHFKLHSAIGQVSSTDDYDVEWQGKKTKRKNNQFHNTFGFFSYKMINQRRFSMDSSFLYSKQIRGISGLVYSPSLKASRRDALGLMSISGTYLLSDGYYMGRFSQRMSNEDYQNPDIAVYSHHDVTSRNIQISAKQNVSNAVSWFAQGEFKTEKIQSSDTGSNHRDAVSALVSFTWKSNTISMTPTFRFDKIGHHYQGVTHNTDVVWQQSANLKHIFSFGTSFRAPSFNDMYWTPGGNTDLEPEQAIQVIMTSAWSTSHAQGTMTTRHIQSRNLIQWVPGDHFWYADNIASTNRTSLNCSIELSSSFFDFNSHVTRLWTRDNDHRAPIRYAPDWSGFFSLTTTFSQTAVGLTGHYSGKQIVVYDYPENKSLPNYYTLTTFISTTISFQKREITYSIQIENLFDKSYQTILGYPEPGRALYFTLNIK